MNVNGGTPLPTPAERKTVIGRPHARPAHRNKGSINLDVQHIRHVIGVCVLCAIIMYKGCSHRVKG